MNELFIKFLLRIKDLDNIDLKYTESIIGSSATSLSILSKLETDGFANYNNGKYNLNSSVINAFLNKSNIVKCQDINIEKELFYVNKNKKLDWTEERPIYYIFLTIFLTACLLCVLISIFLLLGTLNIISI